MTMDYSKELDARGLNCPLPILKTKKALAEMSSGEVLRVMATDPGAVRDFQAFAKQSGNELLSPGEDNKECAVCGDCEDDDPPRVPLRRGFVGDAGRDRG